MQTCTFQGETDVCSNFYQLSGGTVTGVANQTNIGEAGLGGYPYFCFMTGTLDCKAKKLVGGWIQCVYCVAGVISDGGMGCDPSVAGLGTGIAGKFAGPLTANYDTVAAVAGEAVPTVERQVVGDRAAIGPRHGAVVAGERFRAVPRTVDGTWSAAHQ